jgi:tRNA U34 5-methylaminomethyl-2-thiouridine-forming methyltransferase MnmC
VSGWRAQRTADGSTTLVHPLHGETCHSLAGAWTQARERYAAECRLRARALALAASGAARLRLLDVGTGLGLNLAAALEALDGTGVALDALSLEIDAGVLAWAAATPQEPESLERWHAPVRAALRAALADPPGAAVEGVPLGAGRLRLALWDARAALRDLAARERFDAVFLDPFSPRVEPALWEPAFLLDVARRLAPGGLLSTYCAATAVRAALLAAGLRVGQGARVGAKREGTVASPDAQVPPLPAKALRRLQERARVLGGQGFPACG